MSRHANILQTIGNTPPVRLNRLAPEGIEVWVKIESFNPALEASRVGAEDVATLAPHGFAAAEIFDVAAAAAAGRAFFTKLLDALGVQMDAPFLATSAVWRRALVVGRPIDTRRPVARPAARPEAAPAEGERHVA